MPFLTVLGKVTQVFGKYHMDKVTILLATKTKITAFRGEITDEQLKAVKDDNIITLKVSASGHYTLFRIIKLKPEVKQALKIKFDKHVDQERRTLIKGPTNKSE